MKSHTHYLTLNVPSKMEFVNITTEVEEAVRASGAHSFGGADNGVRRAML
jgi:thiamine phosphate synthase YjbQ (UPF0047 family)